MNFSDKEPSGNLTKHPFEPGNLVCLVADQTKIGAIIQVEYGSSEPVYKVLLDGRPQSLFASQIRPWEKSADLTSLSLDELNCHLSAMQIRHPDNSSLYSLNAARIDYMPWQFRPVLKFIHSDRPRLLIADSVGVGKTIEAGLIVRELEARMELKSILIICPKPLIVERKWESEMKRFDEQFVPLDSKGLRYCINEMDMDGEWPERFRRIIVPYSLLTEDVLQGWDGKSGKKRLTGLLQLDPPPQFDLVIIDEAHHIRNDSTWAHRCARFFCENASAAIFLTATPVMMGNKDLYTLLNLLRPDLIMDETTFEEMSEPNKFITAALRFMQAESDGWQEKAVMELQSAARTSWGKSILMPSPAYNAIVEELGNKRIDSAERVRLIKEVEGLHTFDRLINRTRRRDIGNFTIRKPETVPVAFTEEQHEIYDELIRLQAAILRLGHPDQNVRFMMCTLLRQAASCIFGLAPLVSEILSHSIESLEEIDEAGMFQASIEAIREDIKALQIKAASLKGTDPKLDALKKVIADKQKLPSNKLMLFSSFRHTLAYLEKNLSQCGVRVAVIHGGVQEEERLRLRNRFELPREDPDAIDLLLFSEIGSEGLDYQFCDALVNYDLPWNPMRIEQRIGRIDRNGQQSEVVQIFNLITLDTIDADIYYRCLERIGIFNASIGESDEILGDLAKEIRDIGEAFNLSPDERRKKLQRLADNAIRREQEEERLEKSHSELFGIALPEDRFASEIQDASSFWLSADKLENMLRFYLERLGEGNHDPMLGSGALKTLRLKQSARESLLADFKKLPKRRTPAWRQWENWLKGSSPWLEITFDPQCAKENPEVVLLNPLHPLIRQAADAFSPEGKLQIRIRSKMRGIAPGDYEFALYQWRYIGSRERTTLVPIANDQSLEKNLVALFRNAENLDPSECQCSIGALEDSHHRRWKAERERYIEKTRNQASFRKTSLETSHRARMASLEAILDRTTDPKLLLMRRSQIANAEADFKRHLEEIERSASCADILAESVAFGVIEVREE